MSHQNCETYMSKQKPIHAENWKNIRQSMHILHFFILLIILIYLPGCGWYADPYMSTIAKNDFLDSFQKQMPAGYSYKYVSYDDYKAYKCSSYFIVDFFNDNIQCARHIKLKQKSPTINHPFLRLQFHKKIWDANILDRIKSKAKKGEIIPQYFDETPEYIILKSRDGSCPEGDDSSKSQCDDLEQALKEYFRTLK
jgi:hypothetical protein